MFQELKRRFNKLTKRNKSNPNTNTRKNRNSILPIPNSILPIVQESSNPKKYEYNKKLNINFSYETDKFPDLSKFPDLQKIVINFNQLNIPLVLTENLKKTLEEITITNLIYDLDLDVFKYYKNLKKIYISDVNSTITLNEINTKLKDLYLINIKILKIDSKFDKIKNNLHFYLFNIEQPNLYFNSFMKGYECWVLDNRKKVEITYKNGDIYKGYLHEGKLNGQGTVNFANGSKYIGEIQNNIIYGKGILFHNYKVYDGLFKGTSTNPLGFFNGTVKNLNSHKTSETIYNGIITNDTIKDTIFNINKINPINNNENNEINPKNNNENNEINISNSSSISDDSSSISDYSSSISDELSSIIYHSRNYNPSSKKFSTNYKKIDDKKLKQLIINAEDKESAKLGEGGFGKVYLCENKDENKNKCYKFAFKKFKKFKEMSIEEEFYNNIEILNILKKHCSDYFLCFYKPLIINNNYYLLFEYLDYTLTNFLETDYYKKSEIILNNYIIIKLIKGIEKLHELGILHLDIKPSNIMIQLPEDSIDLMEYYDYEKIKVKYTDYDLSCIINSCWKKIKGTPNYLHPIIYYQKFYTPSIDYFALTITYFNIIYKCSPEQYINKKFNCTINKDIKIRYFLNFLPSIILFIHLKLEGNNTNLNNDILINLLNRTNIIKNNNIFCYYYNNNNNENLIIIENRLLEIKDFKYFLGQINPFFKYGKFKFKFNQVDILN